MKIRFICYLLVLFLLPSAYVRADDRKITAPCPEGINLLPMYGKVKKCKGQLESDKAFLKACDDTFTSRKDAANEHINMAWAYANRNDVNTAMKRLNQAWLLDSLNADAYWGFGVIEGSKGNYFEAKQFLEKSIELNSTNKEVWHCLAVLLQKIEKKDRTPEIEVQLADCLEKSLGYVYHPAIKILEGITEDDIEVIEIIKVYQIEK